MRRFLVLVAILGSACGNGQRGPGLPVDGGSVGLGAPSHGGTLTFEEIGAPGWYPSRRDPATGPCDAYQDTTCCLAKKNITSDALTPWDEELILTLRGPMVV